MIYLCIPCIGSPNDHIDVESYPSGVYMSYNCCNNFMKKHFQMAKNVYMLALFTLALETWFRITHLATPKNYNPTRAAFPVVQTATNSDLELLLS